MWPVSYASEGCGGGGGGAEDVELGLGEEGWEDYVAIFVEGGEEGGAVRSVGNGCWIRHICCLYFEMSGWRDWSACL